MKKVIVVGAVLVMVLGGYSLYASLSKDNLSEVMADKYTSPTRPAEINGYLTSIVGNEITIANEIGREQLTEAEQAEKKALMQKMSQEERAAARLEETSNYKTENISFNIPVGIPIVRGTGDADGEVVSIDIAEIVKGMYLSVWTSAEGKVEYVKIKGV